MRKVCWACLLMHPIARGIISSWYFLHSQSQIRLLFPFHFSLWAKMHSCWHCQTFISFKHCSGLVAHCCRNCQFNCCTHAKCSVQMHWRKEHCCQDIQCWTKSAKNILENPFPSSNQRSREKFQKQLNVKETVCARRLICQRQETGQELIHFAQRSLKDVKFLLLWLHLVV